MRQLLACLLIALFELPTAFIQGQYSYDCDESGDPVTTGLNGDLRGPQYSMRLRYPGQRAFLYDFSVLDQFTGTPIATYERDSLDNSSLAVVSPNQPGPGNGIRLAMSLSDSTPIPGLPPIYLYTMTDRAVQPIPVELLASCSAWAASGNITSEDAGLPEGWPTQLPVTAKFVFYTC
ncbi:hypothetical protein N2152v2_001604 [Parachlorella kessleri]